MPPRRWGLPSGILNMINLIPNEEKKKMEKDFLCRLAAFSLLMLGSSVLVGLFLLLPSYVLSSIQASSVADKIKLQEAENAFSESDMNTLQTVETLRKKIAVVEEAEKNKNIFSRTVLDEILSRRTGGIKIIGVYYKNEASTPAGKDGRGEIVNVAGTAADREALIRFRESLEAGAAFSKVELPISNLVRASNITFTLTLTPRRSQLPPI